MIRRAVILAAGRGKRLGALTADRPKPLLAVRGRPLLEWIIVGLRDEGLSEFLCVVGYLGDRIREYFGTGARRGVRMDYVEQGGRHGTGAALQLGRSFAGDEPVVMSYGDILTDPRHYAALLGRARGAHADAVMGINRLPDVSAGAAVLLEGDRVTGIIEKPPPDAGLSDWNQAGVTAFGPAIWQVHDDLPLTPRGEYELTEGIAMLIRQGSDVRAVRFDGFWSDVGTPEALEEAERLWRPTRGELPVGPP